MPACAEVNNAMQGVTRTAFTTSEQHKECMEARIERDQKDIKEIENFLQHRNPFTSDPSLRNITSGVTADSSVNVDKAKDVGLNIVHKMEGENVAQYTFRRNNRAVTLAAKHSIKVDGELVQIAPELLFQRYIAASEVMENPEEIFKHELCAHPAALFDNMGMMRKANKPAPTDAISTLYTPDEHDPSCNVHFVLDGGSLLHRVPWPHGLTYDAIAEIYVNYVKTKFGQSTVIVFDGYEGGPSTKDSTHERRCKGYREPTITFTEDMVCKSPKEHFLSNSANKQRMINLMGRTFEDKGFRVFHSEGDADLLIVQTAIQEAITENTVVVGEDTDLLVLLCHHAQLDSHPIFFKQTGKTSKVWNIQNLKKDVGNEVCKYLLFGHAILGCDTTSSIFGVGKGIALKLIIKNKNFRKQAAIFSNEFSSKKEIEEAGQAALLIVYGGKHANIDRLRHEKFSQKVATSSVFVHPQVLPPTASATKYHSFRVYLQVQQWLGRADLNPTDWGWNVKDGKLTPKETDLPPAPPALLKVIRCNCKTSCTRATCSCRKHGLLCSPACGECRGVSCTNAPHPEIADSFDEDDM